MKTVYLFISLFIFQFNSLAQELAFHFVPIGTGKKYFCLDTDQNHYYLSTVSDPLSPLDVNKLRNKTRSKIAKIKQQIADLGSSSKRKASLAEQKALLKEIKSCSDSIIHQNIYSPCGVISGLDFEAATRPIINGVACADSGSPFVFLAIESDQGVGFCTGNIISPNIVLTAAHCVSPGPIFSVTAFYIGGSLGASTYAVNPLFINQGLFDIALLSFDQTFNVAPAALNGSGFILPGETGIIGGFGYDEFGNSKSLRAGIMQIQGRTTSGILAYFSAVDEFPDSNTCFGDSGGPLLVRRSGHWVVTGLTSFGDNLTCGLNGIADSSFFSDLTMSENISFIQSAVPDATFFK